MSVHQSDISMGSNTMGKGGGGGGTKLVGVPIPAMGVAGVEMKSIHPSQAKGAPNWTPYNKTGLSAGNISLAPKGKSTTTTRFKSAAKNLATPPKPSKTTLKQVKPAKQPPKPPAKKAAKKAGGPPSVSIF